MKKNSLLGLVAAIAVLGVVGCTPEARQDYNSAGDKIGQGVGKAGEAAQTDAAKTGEAVGDAAENAGQTVKEGAEKTAAAAKNAGEAVKDSAEKAGETVAKSTDNAKTTFDVKNAILSADNLDASDLNVDTVDNVVYLKGSVPTAEAKKRAETLAKNIVAKGITVKNELTVKPK